MTPAEAAAWAERSQRHLAAALERPRAALRRHLARDPGAAAPLPPPPAPGPGPAPALEAVAARLALSPFERDLLLLCAGVELDPTLAALCAEAQGPAGRPAPTFALALAALDGAHWDALTPAGPLRRWRLLEVGPGDTLTGSPLRIDERVLHLLAGVAYLDERLAALLTPLPPGPALPPSQQAQAARVAAAWSSAAPGAPPPAVHLDGSPADCRAAAAAACAGLGLRLHALAPGALPAEPAALEALSRLIEREALLGGLALLIDGARLDPGDAPRAAALEHLVDLVAAPVALLDLPRRPGGRPLFRVAVGRPTPDEQRAAWAASLAPGRADPALIDELVAQFNLDAGAVASVAAQARAGCGGDTPPEAVWEGCRLAARPRLDDLAQRIEAGATWDDLVLPESQLQILTAIAVQVRRRSQVYERWGMGRAGRGLGISALFAGPSGTGKTTAAEALASALRLDLYRIDLSAVVSKYIGETEKNLGRVFDAAEAGGAILLFDEADALFGKRSEVKDSHDRHANIEVSYLLQRMESYRGLAVLTTNLKQALDVAFLRRIRFVVSFPFPDAAQRAELWRRAFPAATPTAELDYGRLARLNVAGGNIRNIALGAAFLAADEGAPVGMAHVLRSARAEYAKLERTVTEAEVAGWV